MHYSVVVLLQLPPGVVLGIGGDAEPKEKSTYPRDLNFNKFRFFMLNRITKYHPDLTSRGLLPGDPRASFNVLYSLRDKYTNKPFDYVSMYPSTIFPFNMSLC